MQRKLLPLNYVLALIIFISFSTPGQEDGLSARDRYLNQFRKVKVKKSKIPDPPKEVEKPNVKYKNVLKTIPPKKSGDLNVDKNVDPNMDIESHRKASQQAILNLTGKESIEDVVEGNLSASDFKKAAMKFKDKIVPKGSEKNSPGVIQVGKGKVDVNVLLQTYRSTRPEISKAQLADKLKGKPIVSNPKFIDFYDDFMRHPTALLEMTKVIGDKTRLMAFLGVNIILFLFGYLFKKLLIHHDLDFFPKLKLRLFKFGLLNSLRLGAVIYFFGKELSPTFNLAKDHLTKAFF